MNKLTKMKLILFDLPGPSRMHFHPLALSRPIWELRLGLGTLAQMLVARVGARPAGCFVPPHLADAYRTRTGAKVNDPSVLQGNEDLLLVHGRVKAESLSLQAGPSEVQLDGDEVVYAWIAPGDLARAPRGDIAALLEWARHWLPKAQGKAETWNYIWELVSANGQSIAKEFAAAGHSGVEGQVEEPFALRGNGKELFIARGATVQPMVVIDTTAGPVYIDDGAEVQPFTRIEGPCYIGKGTVLLGAKCRAGNSIGPMCRIGGEIEASIVQGYSNKYHDGFLGHAYVGEWVNLGALTSNSDLKNDYSSVSVVLDGHTSVDTGAMKVGALVGDHARTSIGTLFNTGAYVGAMTLMVASGRLMPKFIPSFSWVLDGAVAEGRGKERSYVAARVAMSRRQCAWTPQEQAMWDAIFDLTAPERAEAIRRANAKG